MDQAINTQARAVTTQAQAMTSQANREVVPQGNQQVSTMAFCLSDFTRMHPPSYYESNVKENPQEFIDEIYNILMLWDGIFFRRSGSTLTNSKMWLKHGTSNEGTICL